MKKGGEGRVIGLKIRFRVVLRRQTRILFIRARSSVRGVENSTEHRKNAAVLIAISHESTSPGDHTSTNEVEDLVPW